MGYFRGSLFVLTFFIASQSFANFFSCRGYFIEKPFPLIDVFEKRSQISWTAARSYTHNTVQHNTHEQIERASQLSKTAHFIVAVSRELNVSKKKYTTSEVIEAGKAILDLTIKHLDSHGIRYSIQKRKFKKQFVNYLEIEASSRTPFNNQVLYIKNESGIRIIFDPTELLDYTSKALVYKDKLYISIEMIAELNLLNDETAYHERTHALAEKKLRQKRKHPFYGYAESYHKHLPKSPISDGYHKIMNFDEVNAYFSSIKVDLAELIRVLKSSSQLDKELNSMHYAKHSILHDLSFGKRVTLKTRTIAKQAIETLRNNSSILGFDIIEGVNWARWKQLNPSENYYYTMRVEVAEYIGNMSYAEKLTLMENKMRIMKAAADYFHNQFSLADIVVKYVLRDPQNPDNIRLLEFLNHKLVRRLNFGPQSYVPTFTEYLQTFEEDLRSAGIPWNRN